MHRLKLKVLLGVTVVVLSVSCASKREQIEERSEPPTCEEIKKLIDKDLLECEHDLREAHKDLEQAEQAFQRCLQLII